MLSKTLHVALLTSALASNLRQSNTDTENQLLVAKAKQSPVISSLKDNLKTELADTEWLELNNNLMNVVDTSYYCNRRHAMARVAGLLAGETAATVAQPAYVAETKEVKMGSDSGELVFVPIKTSICQGDSVKWINNNVTYDSHIVTFNEEDIPAGVNYYNISMSYDNHLEEGESFVMKFDVAGRYEYYCEPHRAAGMDGRLVVEPVVF